MPLKNIQYDEIMREYNRRQLENKHRQEICRKKAYGEIPRLKEIDEEVATLSASKIRAMLTRGETSASDLKAQIALLAEERRALLLSHGYPADYLEIHYTCPLCQDTGYIGMEKCTCFRKAAIDLLYAQSNLKEILKKENFAHFSFDYYSDKIKNEATGLSERETARQAVEKAHLFIDGFDTSWKNLLIYGDTGVGKTFLSHCIAQELIESGHSVVYFSAFDLFDLLSQSAFSKNISREALDDFIFSCDLLIIDDLGTELTNSFISSQFFLCVNERIMRNKSTIISTNLTINSLFDLYSERTFSRIISNYELIKLIGKDIRIQKKCF